MADIELVNSFVRLATNPRCAVDGSGLRGAALLPEERRIDVGPMDLGVAADAGC